MSSKHAAAHDSPNGPGDARPTAAQVLQDEGLLSFPNRLAGKTILITGGTSGLGLELAKTLHQTGAKVFVTGRCDASKGEEIVMSIKSSADQKVAHPVSFIRMDQSDLASVKTAASAFLSQANDSLNILICNAGVMSPQTHTRTVQGHEMQFGVNHLSHFLLFELLCPALVACCSNDLASRAVVVSSCAHRGSGLVEGSDYDFENRPYDAGMGYGQSKTANAYMANEIERQFGKEGLHGVSVHPGVIMETGLVRHLTDDVGKFEGMLAENSTFRPRTKNSSQGAGSIMWAAVASSLEGKGGLYLEDCAVGQPVKKDAEWWDPGTSEWCYDQDAEGRLWSDSKKMVEAWL